MSNANPKKEGYIPCKVIIVGDSGVGKTSIVSRYLKRFNENEKSTVGASYSNRAEKIDNYNICFDIWDTAGQEKFRSVNTIFYRDANICILVYDITRKESFESLKTYWHKTVKELGADDILFGVAGNKIDKFEEEAVEPQEGKDFAASIGAEFHLTSALQNTSIDELFQDLGKRFTQTGAFRILEEEYNKKNSGDNKQKLENNGKEKKKGCC